MRNNLSKPRAINIKTSIVKKGINGRIKVYKSIKIINIIGEQQSIQEFLGVLEKSTRSDSPKEIWEAIMIKTPWNYGIITPYLQPFNNLLFKVMSYIDCFNLYYLRAVKSNLQQSYKKIYFEKRQKKSRQKVLTLKTARKIVLWKN